jgi:hypothetical protein
MPCCACPQSLQFLDEDRRGSCGVCYARAVERFRDLLNAGACSTSWSDIPQRARDILLEHGKKRVP